jgi:signal peptidase I
MEPTLRQKLLSAVFIVFVVTLFMRLFVIEGFVVKGDSMAPAVLSGDYVFVNKLAYTRKDPSRGDIVVAKPRDYKIRVLKRIIGLPGERFEIVDGRVTLREGRLDFKVPLDELYLSIQDTPAVGIIHINLDPQEYFTLGDSRNTSIDSRELGPIDRWSIKGKVIGVFRLRSLTYKSL